MGIGGFIVLQNMLRSSGSGGGDTTRRCSKCGEPITRLGKFGDRHPILSGLGFAGSVAITGILIALSLTEYAEWDIHKNYPHQEPCSIQQSNGESVCATFRAYEKHEWEHVIDNIEHF